MKNIVVPTDFSPCSMSALKTAILIAKKLKAGITLVHTYTIPVYGFTSGHVMYDGEQLGKVKQEIKDELKRIASEDFIKEVKVKTLLLPDFSIEQIASHEDLKNTDLIVMGTHGTSGIGDLIGSNTEKMIRHSDIPVLVLREGSEKNFNIKNIVFASTFFWETYEQFPKVQEFAKLFDANIHLLHVNTPHDFITSEFSENLMLSFKEKFQLKDATLNTYNDESVEDGVIHFSHKISADMVVLETHGRTGINHILNGSITEDVANHIEIPVLTYRIKEIPKPRGVIFPESR